MLNNVQHQCGQAMLVGLVNRCAGLQGDFKCGNFASARSLKPPKTTSAPSLEPPSRVVGTAGDGRGSAKHQAESANEAHTVASSYTAALQQLSSWRTVCELIG